MGVTVREVSAQPHLLMDLVAGAAGLDNTVTWAHSSDLPDPSGWLTGGEMVMKNGRTLPREAAAQVAFVGSLVTAGASALVIGLDQRTPRLTQPMIEHADTLRFPVLRVPFSMPFALIGRAVAEQAVRGDTTEIARTARIYGLIGDAVARGHPAQFLAKLRQELDCPVFVIDSETAANVLPGTPPLPPASRSTLRTALERNRGHGPAVLRAPETDDTELAAITVPYEEPTLLVVRHPRGRHLDMPLLQHAATVTAVEVSYASLRQDHQRELGTELLTQLLESTLTGEAAERDLAAQGIEAAHARLLATSHPGDGSQRRLHHRLTRRGIHHVLARRRDTLFVLVSTAGPKPTMDIVHSQLGDEASLGISDLLRSGSRTPDAAREALWALAASKRTGSPVYYGSASALPAIRDPNQAQALVDRVLGPVIEHDNGTGGELLHSLATFLSCRRSWVRTAEALHLHRQTVIYRMRQVEQLTGRDLGDTQDIAELWLALAAHDAITGDTTTRQRTEAPSPAARSSRPGRAEADHHRE